MDRQYKYLIVGGGMAGGAAIRGIRAVDSNGSIGIVSADTDRPYKRPWLSKSLWKGDSIDDVWLKVPDDTVELNLGRTVQKIDLDAKQVHDDQGDTYSYETLLITTGVSPRHVAPNSDRVIAYRTLGDFRKLSGLAKEGKRFAVVGSGFIGSELAAALTMNHKQVEMIYPNTLVCERLFPTDLATFVTDRYRNEQVTLRPGMKASKITDRGNDVLIELVDANGAASGQIEVDAVVTGIGAQPNDQLAKDAGLNVDNGIIVDEMLRAGRPDVYAAGDVARFYQPSLGESIRIEHEDNAIKMGEAAGRAMAGQGKPYTHLPFFYSDLFDLGYEAVGILDSRLEAVEDWIEPMKEGVVYYVDKGKIRGVLLWNHWDKVPTARKVIGTDLPKAGEGMRKTLLES